MTYQVGVGGVVTTVADTEVFVPASTSSADLLDAFDAAKAVGGVLQLDVGTYTLSSQMLIDAPVTVRGLGWASVIQVDSGVAAFLPILGQDLGTDDPIPGVVLENFCLDGNQAGLHDSGLIQLNNCVGFSVDRLWIKDGGLTSTYVNGIAVSAGTVGGVGSEGVISRCLIEGNTKAGVNITTESVHVVLRDSIVRNNTGDLGQVPGVQVNGGFNATVTGNAIYDNQGDGIVLAASGTSPATPAKNTIVSENQVSGNGFAGIAVRNGEGSNGVFGRFVIRGNQVHGNGSATSGHGIHIENQVDGSVDGNIVTTSYYSGIVVNASTRIAVEGNKCWDNNSAGNSDMGGILLIAANDCTIDRNRCGNVNTTDSKYGLIFYNTQSSRIAVRNNDFRSNATASVYHHTAPTLVMSSGNIHDDGDFPDSSVLN